MNKLFKSFTKITIGILVILLLGVISLIGLRAQRAFYIVAKFSDSGPLYKNMPVYHKGYKLGNVKNVWPSPDYKFTFIKIVFDKKPKLSANVTAEVKTLNVKKNYISLMTEDETSTAILKKGAIISGEGSFDMESFLSDIADSGLIIPLIQNFSDTAVSLNKTSEEIGKFFSDSRITLKENKNNLKQTTNNLNKMSNSLNEVSTRINTSVSNDKIESTTSNILSASENIKKITQSVDCATQNLSTTRTKIDSTINNANSITCDVKIITRGLRQTLSKRFAGMKIMFGKPVDNCTCPKNCSN